MSKESLGMFLIRSAYRQGVEDGIRQERERIREALDAKFDQILDDTTDIMGGREPEDDGMLSGLSYAIEVIGLGAVTTEESEK